MIVQATLLWFSSFLPMFESEITLFMFLNIVVNLLMFLPSNVIVHEIKDFNEF